MRRYRDTACALGPNEAADNFEVGEFAQIAVDDKALRSLALSPFGATRSITRILIGLTAFTQLLGGLYF